MSSVHCIVVWEYQERGEWLPHTPSVTRTLERAHAKKLTRVVLADADPALKGHYVNLRTLTQSRDTPDGGSVECLVRRWCYSVTSVGGRGARWEWARLTAPPLPADLDYRPMSMEMQCAVEEAWSSGIEVVLHNGWTIQPSRGAARRGGARAVRLVRRAPQPPYPLTRSEAPPLPTRNLQHTIGHRPRIPQQHTGSSVQSTRSAPPTAATSHALSGTPGVAPGSALAAAPQRPGARSASPRERKPGLARQILHNLNIFSTTKQPPLSPRARSPSSRTEDCSNRRHSVDTVSTYLSHESKDSLQQGSVELLNCSGGSDDVFEATHPIVDITTDSPEEDDDDDEMYLGGLCRVVSRAGPPQWGAVCPVCVQPLAGRATRALNRCRHMLHRDCLRDAARRIQGPLQIQCLVCGETYRETDDPIVTLQRHGAGGAGAPLAPVTSRDVARQPPGSMAWRLQHVALPNTDCDTSILVTYNFQSGVQGVDDPVPGAPYYAVGFPRHSVLPDTVEGRQVLSLLRVAWERGVLFCVSASRTTGREHVVSWRVPPPPAPRDYTPQRLQRAKDCLHGLLAQHS